MNTMNDALIRAIAEVALVFCLMFLSSFFAFYAGRRSGAKEEKRTILEIIGRNTKILTSFNVELCNHAQAVCEIQAECESPTHSGLINYED